MEKIQSEIVKHMDDPDRLEALYRLDKAVFMKAFTHLYPQISDYPASKFWMARLSPRVSPVRPAIQTHLHLVLILGAVIALFSKVPNLFALDPEYFYSRHIGFIIFPAFGLYMAKKQQLSFRKWVYIGVCILLGLIYINLLPESKDSDVLMLVCMHFPLLLWALTGYAYIGGITKSKDRLAYLRFNGDWVILTGLIFLAGMLLSGITIGLFSLIEVNIEERYFQYIGVPALSLLPLMGGYMAERNPELVGKIAPVIAKLFSPLALLVLIAFLSSMLFMGKNPYQDREFLLIFNLVLIAVMALVFFSVIGAENQISRIEIWVLTGLSLITILINGIALSAIGFRIAEWGFTPNRTAVLGSNLLMLVHLVFICRSWIWVIIRKAPVSRIGQIISDYLPVYLIWVGIVSFLFPLLFGWN